MKIPIVLLVGLIPAGLAGQTHDHADRRGLWWAWGARAIPVLTHAAPAQHGTDLTEGYFSQPSIFLHAGANWISTQVMLNFEGLTLERGELNAGTWGEGYVDRRHPHTYLHEAVLTAAHELGSVSTSITAGRGFAPFGTDDPMSRPFVKFPANHHLAHVLERLVLVGAVRFGPLGFEAGLLNGDEPLSPSSLGTLDRFGDSWTARLTAHPHEGYELQVSFADLESPEQPEGFALDQRKWDVSLRGAREQDRSGHYFLLEWARTAQMQNGREAFALNSWLGEASVRRGPWRTGLRLERTERPEEERVGNIFRTPWPPTDVGIFGGLTRWVIATGNLSHAFSIGGVRVAPVLEVSRQWAKPITEPALFEPRLLFGSEKLWSLSLGVRLGAGMTHQRMGRYGAAQ